MYDLNEIQIAYMDLFQKRCQENEFAVHCHLQMKFNGVKPHCQY